MNLQEHWERKLLPDMYELCFATGRVINFDENASLSHLSYEEELVIDFEDAGYEIEVYDSITTPKSFKVYHGAGALGNNTGFIAYEGLEGGLIWSLLLSYSTPFKTVQIVDGLIVASTEVGYIFKIPIDHPEKMTCESKKA